VECFSFCKKVCYMKKKVRYNTNRDNGSQKIDHMIKG